MIKKEFRKKKPIVKVTFQVPAEELNVEEGDAVATVHLVGDFNDWDETATRMKKVRGKQAWKTSLDLDKGKEYQFRYLVNGEKWENAWEADVDGYAANNVAGDNSIISTIEA